MSALATAYVQIIPSADGIKKQLTETLDNEMPSGSSYGQSFGGKFATAIKAAIAAAGIGEAIKSAISEGMDLEQNLGGTAAVFGDFAASIQKNAVDAYKNMGLSASDYMATANKMGSLFQGSGLEQQRAMDLTAAAMQRAADVASVMGLDMQAASSPTIFGMAGGTFLGGGEAGPEVVAGADTLMGMMRSAVSDGFAGQLDRINDNFDKLFAIMGQYYPQFAAAGVYLDSGVLVGEMAPAMDKALGRLSQQRGRGR